MRSKKKIKILIGNHPDCIWMQADVVSRKSCQMDYNCPECRFDRAMRHVAHENDMLKKKGKALAGKRGTIVLWKEKLTSLPIAKRPCVHHMKGRIEFRICTNEYRCGKCDFDQYFHDQYSVHAVVNPVNVLETKGFRIPQGYYFHRGHTWVKIEEKSSVRVGVDDFALRMMGPLNRIEAPLMGKEVKQGRADISLFRGEHQAKLLSPISGVVTDINVSLRDHGSLANDDPYAEGWVMRVQPDNLRQDLNGLMINRETEDFIGDQVEHLYRVIEEVAGPLAADGGNLGRDIFGGMPQLGWERLIHTFLHT
ncbi:glycine cleavage system protein H [Deltaproteobacteria bacterium]|nr:glycine cleavage system protein H [Deltaproteobacteria bacterium]